MEPNTLSLSSAQLRQAADIRQKIEDLTSQLEAILGGSAQSVIIGKDGRKMTAEGRARIAAAQKLRWAKLREAAGEPDSRGKRRKIMSPAQRAKIAAAARLRWKKARAAGRNRL
jgi:hypothetical protein